MGRADPDRLGGWHLRFSELRGRVDGISRRMPAKTLQVFESDCLVTRRAPDVVPPHVDYTLTPLGAEFASRVLTLACWIEDNLAKFLAPKAT